LHDRGVSMKPLAPLAADAEVPGVHAMKDLAAAAA
jgi:hypothetical protein